ncbi:hypothetical protein GCM10009733_091820 [Nonomuraea maheshkhaliensis]|uniref:Uncharacterized protein n=1 Tax=Nonomuraea maheshkhaliensis TaxID=419590 RepID=A0ABN2H2R9_9ACTN
MAGSGAFAASATQASSPGSFGPLTAVTIQPYNTPDRTAPFDGDQRGHTDHRAL